MDQGELVAFGMGRTVLAALEDVFLQVDAEAVFATAVRARSDKLTTSRHKVGDFEARRDIGDRHCMRI
ncbi:hypothetical protein [Paracoccus cavernae]|uniref:hypothetical protein n=1 Tax=Paracoccus cavernae TaxID=1571207 RepID=UPI0036318D22